MSQEMPTVYPVSNTVPTSNHSSNGSYGAVFIVLAVIIILSAFACFLGRLFNKRQDDAKPSKHNLPTKEKHAMPMRNAKDGDIEFGHDKKFTSAKVAATSEPTMGRPNSLHEPTMGRPNSLNKPTMGPPNSFQEPTMGRPSSFQEPYKMGSGSNSFGEPAMGRPTNSYQEPYKVGSDSFREPTIAMGRPDSFDQPAMMRRLDSFHEPTMGRPSSFDKGESQGEHQMGFDANRDNKLNFIPRTRPQRY